MDLPIDVSPWQADLLNDDTRFISISGGLGSGKTHLIGVYLLIQCLQYPGCYGWCCNNTEKQSDSSTWMAVQNFLSSISEYLTELGVHYRFTHDYKLEFSNGSTVLFQTLGIPLGRLKGSELDFLIIDEADAISDPEKWQYVKARLRGKIGSRQARVFSNPIHPLHWTIDGFVGKDDHMHVEISTYMNTFLDQDIIDKYEQDYPPGTPEHERWMLGKATSMEGAAFKQFSMDRHVVKPSQIPDAANIYIYGMDLGYNDPTTFIEGRMTQSGHLYITKEYGKEGMDPELHLPNLLDIYVDGPVFADHSATQHSYYARHGLAMVRANKKDKTKMVEMLRRRFHYDAISISTDCPRLLKDLALYEEEVTPSGKLRYGYGKNHKWSHFCDALQYMVMGVDEPSLLEA